MKFSLIFSLVLFFLAPLTVNADIAFLLHEAQGVSGEMTGAGHIAIYISNVCADSPLAIRKCRHDEQKGVVMATYPNFGTDKNYEWLAMPLMPYLYGVDSEQAVPLYANGEIRTLLDETNRAKYLSKIIPAMSDGTLAPGRWSMSVGQGFNRDLYAFTVKTTAEQDARFIEKYSTTGENNDFNVMFKNCADFVGKIMNFYFPNSSSRDFINDFGMTTPKGLARSFKKYTNKRPAMLFHVTKYPQIDGPIMRSFGMRNFTEMAFTSKKYFVTELLTMPVLMPLFAGTYYLTGYFNIDSAYRDYPSAEMARLNLQKHLRSKRLDFVEDTVTLEDIENSRKAEKKRIFGEKQTWEKYRRELKPMIANALKEQLFADDEEVKKFYNHLEAQSEPFLDENGELMLKVNNYGQEALLGITRRNILNANSDVRLAYKLMLVKVEAELGALEKNRETMEVFDANWQLLQELSKRAAALPPVQMPNNRGFLTTPRKSSFKKKFTKVLVKVLR